jgi:hypothetical protein
MISVLSFKPLKRGCSLISGGENIGRIVHCAGEWQFDSRRSVLSWVDMQVIVNYIRKLK